MENFYNLFNVDKNASNSDIILSYKSSVKKFNNMKILSIEQINEIKMLKSVLYILLNKQLRQDYNNILYDNIEPIDNYENNNLNAVFNIDNSWMNNIQEHKSLKKKSDTNFIGDRIFSLMELNKNPDLTDINVILRTPMQGRIDKNTQEL
jgi:hypothetical protein